MAGVRPEYGPSLFALAAPRWRRLARPLQVVLAILAALILVALAAKLLRDATSSATNDAIVGGKVPFTLGYPDGLERVRPQGDEVLRLTSGASREFSQAFTVAPLRLPAYRGDSSAGFLAGSARMVAEMRRAYPDFVYRGEGRARVAELPGYQIQFSTRDKRGHLVYGRRVLLVPDEPGAREGIDVTMLADRSPAVVNVDAVGNNGLLKTPYRSLRFGTERHG